MKTEKEIRDLARAFRLDMTTNCCCQKCFPAGLVAEILEWVLGENDDADRYVEDVLARTARKAVV